MKDFILLIFMFLISTSYSVELVKDVVYLPSTSQDFTEDSPIKKSSLSSSSAVPMAWIAGDINKTPLKQITVCTWVKSLDQSGTGTIFAYAKSTEKVEFGLIGVIDKETNKEDYDPHRVYVVIKGKRSRIPINLGLDDVRWHHICVTWSSRYGIWKVYKDGKKVEQGMGMKRGKVISPGGRYYLGGGVFKWVEEEEIVNGSDASQVNIRVSTGFRTSSRKKRNVYSTETKRMIGKFTDFYVWKRVVSKAQVSIMSKCSSEFRRHFNKEVKAPTNYANVFRTMRRKRARKSSAMSWAARNVLFAWSVDAITLQRPTALEFSGDLCGYTISIDCETNRILVSVALEVAEWYKAERKDIHMTDHDCVPEQRGDYFVFHLPSMQACGTQRKVVDREVQYSNTISNTPRMGNIFVGQLFRAEVVCKFPLDVSASASPVVPGKTPEAVGKTTVTDPRTGKPDLEALFVLSMDDEFTDPVLQGNKLNTQKPVWAGIAIEGTYSDGGPDDVNVVVDECWTEAEDQRSPLLNQQGCGDSTARVLENGERSSVRMELPTSDMRPNVPTFIGCSFHPCVGDECTPNCDNDGDNRPPISRNSRGRRQRDVIETTEYEIKIGPFVATEEEIHADLTSHDQDDKNSGPDMLLLAIILPSVFVFILIMAGCIVATYLLSRKTRRVHTITKRTWSNGPSRGSRKSAVDRTQSFTFCRPNYSAHSTYPPSFHAIVRAKFQAGTSDDVIEENDVNVENTNTMISTVH